MTIRFLLLNAYAVGGTVRTVVNQANALAAASHDVEVVSVRRHRAEPRFPLHPGVRLRPLVDGTAPPSRWTHPLAYWRQDRPSRLVPEAEVRYDRFDRLTDRRLVRYLRSLRDGVLITTRPALNLLSARFTPPSVVRVGQEHLHYSHHKPELAREIDRWYRRLDAVTVLTAADEDAYRQRLGNGGVRVVCVPNPLSEQGTPRLSTLDRPLIVSAGRLVKGKQFGKLIKAFEPVAQAHPEWQLRIYGAGPEHDRLRKLIHDRHLYNHVYLMGATQEFDRELAKAAVFALASRREGFGMVLAEAMSHGVPPVSFDCPHGPREIITDGHDGLLVPPGDVEGMTAALTRLVQDEALRRKLGGHAAESARRYAPDRIRARWEQLLAELLAAKDKRLTAAGNGSRPSGAAAPHGQ
ncbi:glycosyltransferase family 4 protein [Streptomyces sp. Ru73]|uniref:glycosyltransferase family 4 protein n=1 Tax=Streptomyces sp. Ru73 TaxID=2080748 RepID=UPI000CDD3ADB|nr:glycosyltransferase family 4 protein [Streptomyces sp. Ru73]POX43208.1 glycosyltransferase family 4 protein [Streptomyces sp. Ru73]